MSDKKRRPIEGYMCFGLLLTMTFVMFIGVIFRYVFNASLSWSEELSRYLFIWFIFISTSYAVTERAHIRVEALNGLVPKKIRPYINIIGRIIWFAFSLFVTYLGVTYALSMTTSVSAAMKLPMSLVYFGIPLGYFLMSLRLFFQIIESIKNPEIEIQEIHDDLVKEE
ncbi:TRAP transporter small permease [Pseudogracilibacillus sp. SE30717A]|uniref:TRAP transporter small permease n=1 Tax=Pseudogracilibacillus sp. SE30717A TaxID=3098293 RepID=UPI00300DF947